MITRPSFYRLSVAKEVAKSPSAAGGRRSEGAVCAAVGKCLAHFVARRHCRAPQTFMVIMNYFELYSAGNNRWFESNKGSHFSPENVTFSGLFHVIFACFTTTLHIFRIFKVFGKVRILPARPHKNIPLRSRTECMERSLSRVQNHWKPLRTVCGCPSGEVEVHE